MMNPILLLSAVVILSGCAVTEGNEYTKTSAPLEWSAQSVEIAKVTETDALKNWWHGFEDETLNTLVAAGLKDSPERKIAEARIAEARGIRRSTRAGLFPRLGASASAGQADTGADTSSFYDASFDASYELDVFGQNRAESRAADDGVSALQFAYDDASLTLIGDIVRNYIDMRRYQKQGRIAERNLYSQSKTLELVRNLMEVGESTSLDASRAENLVNTTRASIPAFQRQADAARLSLSVLTGVMPQNLAGMIEGGAPLPSGDLEPLLLSPSDVIVARPDVNAAAAALSAEGNLSYAAMVEIFPQFNLSGLFGLTKSATINSTNVWSAAAGAAVDLIDFGRIAGRIDAQRASEEQAYQTYRKTVLGAVAEVETALSDYVRINESLVSLDAAFENARETLRLSQLLYEEGEISFLDILQAQRTLNTADAALVDAEANALLALARLYKSLGVY